MRGFWVAGGSTVSEEAVVEVARRQARGALLEDVGEGDLSGALAPKRSMAGVLYCRDNAVLCGCDWFEACFVLLDPSAVFLWRVNEGEDLIANAVVGVVQARADALLAGERCALNFLQTLSGTATAAKAWAQAAGGRVDVVDTRKTIPMLRWAQKYAVKVGGLKNHRMGLFDEILVKENHARAAGGVAAAVRAGFEALAAKGLSERALQVEVRGLDELRAAVAAGARRVMLDNFDAADWAEAVAVAGEGVEVEVSGNVGLEALAAAAAAGVHRVSVGAVTKHVRAVDFSFLVAELAEVEDV